MSNADVPLRRWLEILHGKIKTPPMATSTRRQVGFLLGLVQNDELLALPSSRPMPSIGLNCHELRVSDDRGEWRILCQVRPTVVYVADMFSKETRATPKRIIDQCRKRFDRDE